jgi:high affinity sulfate transporter 1
MRIAWRRATTPVRTSTTASGNGARVRNGRRRSPFLQGIVPIERARVSTEVLAGVTLAALGIPEVMGYAKIAGMPVITGLYTILIPIAIFAVLGSSRHLVVGADSATAAILAAGLAGVAPIASPQYVALAGALAIVTGALLVVARLLRLGFFANFLSRSVLIGFLTGVGIQVAMSQVAGMLGVQGGTGGTIRKFVHTLGHIGDTSLTTLAVSLAVIVVIVGGHMLSPRTPGALIAVVGAIFVSWHWDLAAHGVATLGHVPSGLPSIGVPDVRWHEVWELMSTCAALFVVILAQSAATSRAYAARYEEPFDEDVDLVALGAANAAAGLTGTFVVNGSPTKTQIVDSAGGRSQVAMLSTAVLVLVVLLLLTKPLEFLPNAVLAAVVFLIGLQLIDINGMRNIAKVRLNEFVVALITAVTVVVIGVEQAVALAIIVSLVNHLRRGYAPKNSVLVLSSRNRLRLVPATSRASTLDGLVVYHFAASLYFANANRFSEEILAIAEQGEPAVRWFCIEASAIPDIDYTGAQTLRETATTLEKRRIRVVLAEVAPDVRAELDRYDLRDVIENDAYYETAADVIEAYRSTPHG